MNSVIDRNDLQRFAVAQRESFGTALSKLHAGQKRSHWMWYIFPHLRGLGPSEMSSYYGIADREEARAYLAHPLLGPRLIQVCDAVLLSKDESAVAFQPLVSSGHQLDAPPLTDS